MKRYALLLTLLWAVLGTGAQTAREEVLKNIRRSACSMMAYPGPGVFGSFSDVAAPGGRQPFYLSHYGRHGSRHIINPREFDFPYYTLLTAEQEGKLTTLGADVMHRIDDMRHEASARHGELTVLGAQQLQQIAGRMYERFSALFSGEAPVSARSTTAIRCILSMDNFLMQLLRLNPSLAISHDASMADMPTLYHQDPVLVKQALSGNSKEVYDQYCRQRPTHERLMSLLFTDTAYVARHIDSQQLAYDLYRLASILQNTELRNSVTLYDLFTDDEIWQLFQKENAWWYVGYGHTTLNGGNQPFMERHLLKALIADADSCLRLEHPGVQLRFGHETILLPLVCLMGLNGYDLATDDLTLLERREWLCYRIFPMAANVQMVFYRTSPADRDVLVRVLLNENDARLPLKTDCAPFYHWNDVRRYYLDKISSYHAPRQEP